MDRVDVYVFRLCPSEGSARYVKLDAVAFKRYVPSLRLEVLLSVSCINAFLLELDVIRYERIQKEYR